MTTAQLQRSENLLNGTAVSQNANPTPERQGYTLVEILVAITVMGALSAIAIPQFASYREHMRIAQAIADIRKVDLEIQVYRRQNNDWPSTLSDLGVSIGKDPWDRSYMYLKIEGATKTELAKARKDHFLVPLNTDFDLYSVGPDGLTKAPLTSVFSFDDVLRANDGRFVGRGSDY